MQRIDYNHLAPGALAAMLEIQRYVDHCSLERPLLELIKLRSSQLNRCAYCVDMHSKDARALARPSSACTPLRYGAEAPFFNERERAAPCYGGNLSAQISCGNLRGEAAADRLLNRH